MESGMEGRGIYRALTSIMKKVRCVGKNKGKGSDGKATVPYAYRGIDDLYNALHRVFADAEVVILPEALEIKMETAAEEKRAQTHVILKVRYHFTHSDGSSVHCDMIGEAVDYSDKAVNKAMSISLKYALMQILLLPTADMADQEASNDNRVSRRQLDPYVGKILSRARVERFDGDRFRTLENLRAFLDEPEIRTGDLKPEQVRVWARALQLEE